MKNKEENDAVSIRISRDELYRRILILLYKNEELSLSELSQKIGVSVTDLTSPVNFLELKGFIQQVDSAETSEKQKVSLLKGGNCIVGLDLGGTKLYGAVSDIAGNVLLDQEIKIHGKSGEECFDLLAGLIDQLVIGSSRRGLKLVGIGIDVPGRVQLETGVVINAPAVGMRDFPLKERLASRFGYPAYIDNDLKQAALGEAWFGAGRNYGNVVLLAIGTGIAASTVIDGNPLRGAHLRQGELGWMVPGREFLGRKYVGFGALETEASGPGIKSRAKKILSGTPDESFLGGLDAESVFEAAKKGQGWAQQCVAETIEYIAVLIANIMAFYDPDIIILGGGVSRSSEMIIPPVMKLIEGCVLTQPHLVASSLGYKAGALGAIINLVKNCPEFIR